MYLLFLCLNGDSYMISRVAKGSQASASPKALFVSVKEASAMLRMRGKGLHRLSE